MDAETTPRTITSQKQRGKQQPVFTPVVRISLYPRQTHLRPVAKETAAVRSAAAADRFLVAETVQVIVKRQFSSFHTTEAER